MAGARERLCEAMLYLVTENGYDATSLEEVRKRAGVDASEFEKLFASKEELALRVFDIALDDYERHVRAAYESEAEWPDNLRAAAYAVAEWMTENPRQARFGTVEMLWASEHAQVRREEAFLTFVNLIDAGREKAADPDSIPASTASGIIGWIGEMFTKSLPQEDFDPYLAVPAVMSLCVRPYLGEEAATRELTIPPPPHAERG